MYIMNNIIKFIIFYTWTLVVIQVIALPISSKVIEPEINYEVISEENIHTETNEDFNNDEAEVNRSKKSATTFCVEIKSGTPECVPCQPDIINDTVTLRKNEVVLPPEPPCTKDETFLILLPQEVQTTVSLVQVPVVQQIPKPPMFFVAKKPFLEAHFPEVLNDSNVHMQSLMRVDESLPIINPQFSELFQPAENTFAMNKNDNLNLNLNSKENTYPQEVRPPGFELLKPSEDQNMGQNFEYETESQQHPSSIGSLENHAMGQDFRFDVEVQRQQLPFMINQQGSAFNTRFVPSSQYSPSFMNNHANRQMFVHEGVGQFPIQEPAKSQKPVNANDFQTQQSSFSNMNMMMGHDGRSYLVPAMLNGSPQFCLQPELMTNPSLNNINQQSPIQQQNLSASDSQQSSSINNKQWFSREIKHAKETLQVPEAPTTVAPIKSGLKSQDAKGKGGSLSQLNHLKGPSSLSKAKTFGKGQNKDSKSNEKPELKRGNRRETEISVDK